LIPGREGAGNDPHPLGAVLDHVFILIRPWRAGQRGDTAADEIVVAFEKAGFQTSPGRRHPGQGMTLRFDGEAQGLSLVPHPRLPLTVLA